MQLRKSDLRLSSSTTRAYLARLGSYCSCRLWLGWAWVLFEWYPTCIGHSLATAHLSQFIARFLSELKVTWPARSALASGIGAELYQCDLARQRWSPFRVFRPTTVVCKATTWYSCSFKCQDQRFASLCFYPQSPSFQVTSHDLAGRSWLKSTRLG